MSSLSDLQTQNSAQQTSVDPLTDPFDEPAFDTLPESSTTSSGSTRRAIVGGVASIAIFATLIGANFFQIPTSLTPDATKADVTQTQTAGVAITAVGPLEAAVGATVTVSGTGFVGSTTGNVVKFNDTPATITNVVAHTDGATDLSVTVPRLAADTDYTVSLSNANGTASFAETFRLIAQRASVTASTGAPAAGMPEITVIEPAAGAIGSAVYISGNNFDASAVRNSVRFASDTNVDGVPATKVEWVTVAGEKKLKATVPAGATTGRISLVRDNLKAESTDIFTVSAVAVPVGDGVDTPSAPQITAFSTTTVTPGSKLLITGTDLTVAPGLATGVVVKFDEVAGTVRAASTDATGADTLLVEVPAAARSGYVTVEVGGRTAISPTELTVLNGSTVATDPTAVLDPSTLPDDTMVDTSPVNVPGLNLNLNKGAAIDPAATNIELFDATPTTNVVAPSFDTPRALTVRGDATSLTLSWQAPTVGTPASYRVYYGTTPGAYLRRVDVPGAAASVTLTEGFTPGTRYYLALRAVDVTGTESVGAEANAVFGTTSSFSAEQAQLPASVLASGFSEDAIPTIDFGHAAAQPMTVTQNPPTKLSEQGPAETSAIALGIALIGGVVMIARRRKLI